MQMQGREEPDQSEIVIAMEMTDQDMPDFSGPDVILFKLKLRAFATIDEYVLILKNEQLGRLMPVMCRDGRIITENGELKWQRGWLLFVFLFLSQFTFQFMQKYCVHCFFYRRHNVQDIVELGYFNQFHDMVG